MIIEECTSATVLNKGYWITDYDPDLGACGAFTHVAWFKTKTDAEWYLAISKLRLERQQDIRMNTCGGSDPT